MRRRRPAAARSLAVLIVAVLTASVLGWTQPAGAASQSNVERLRNQRRAVQEKRAAQASQVNVLKASNASIGQALDALAANRRSQEAALQAARQKSAAEAARAVQAKAAEARTAARLGALRDAVRRMAIDEYMHGSTPEMDVSPDPTSPMETARRRSLLTAAVGHSSDIADELRSAQQDLDVERRAAESAAESAAAEQRRVEQRLAEVEAAAKQQQALADQAEAKLDRALAEADSLASLDSGLASQISTEQAALARQLRSVRPARPARPGGGGGGGGGGGTTVARRVGNISLTTVRGITVASSIAGRLANLLAAADGAGLSLSGGGYRDSSAQIATRRNNCGTSDYAIYQMPASSCSPPTARPGTSMHEQGLAVDFTNGGRILSRSNPAYSWLKANAAGFGFYNLPSEPWHWSVNGD